MFLFQAEAEIVTKFFTDPLSVLHPFTVLPLLGQVLLLITLFQKKPGKILTYIGIGCIGILMVLMFFIGCISLNFKILLSTLPFLVLAFLTIRLHRKKKVSEVPGL
jgi:peptidoglycan/LPS O-acetylase OafA/YrhL